MDVIPVVRALRRAASVPAGSCAGCAYKAVDQWTPEEVARWGKIDEKFLEYCDSDKMMLDAALLLEQQQTEIEALHEDLAEMKHRLAGNLPGALEGE